MGKSRYNLIKHGWNCILLILLYFCLQFFESHRRTHGRHQLRTFDFLYCFIFLWGSAVVLALFLGGRVCDRLASLWNLGEWMHLDSKYSFHAMLVLYQNIHAIHLCRNSRPRCPNCSQTFRVIRVLISSLLFDLCTV